MGCCGSDSKEPKKVNNISSSGENISNQNVNDSSRIWIWVLVLVLVSALAYLLIK